MHESRLKNPGKEGKGKEGMGIMKSAKQWKSLQKDLNEDSTDEKLFTGWKQRKAEIPSCLKEEDKKNEMSWEVKREMTRRRKWEQRCSQALDTELKPMVVTRAEPLWIRCKHIFLVLCYLRCVASSSNSFTA